MQCIKPVLLNVKGYGGLYVPCGKCIGCRISRAREWALRLVHELESHDCASFFTLTYSDEFLPDNKSISKHELQKFFKRLRRDIEPKRIKYFACGEYGERFGRPHYHAIIFGIGSSDPVVQANWPFGTVKGGTVTYNSTRYVADYIGKSYSGQLGYDVYTSKGLEIPFRISSNGLGKNWALANTSRFKEGSAVLTLRGVRHGLPKYYRKVMDCPVSEIDKIEAGFRDVDQYLFLEDQGLYKFEQSAQRKANMEARIRVKNDSRLL